MSFEYERGKRDATAAILTACAKQLGHSVKEGVAWIAINPDAPPKTVTLPNGVRVTIERAGQSPSVTRRDGQVFVDGKWVGIDMVPSVRSIIWNGHHAFRDGKWVGSATKVRDGDRMSQWAVRTWSIFAPCEGKHRGYYETEADARAVVEGSAGT